MRSVRLVAVGVILSAAAAGRASAQTTYNACYVPNVGAIYLINLPGLPTACLAAAHVPIDWTDGGTLADGSVTTTKLADAAVTPAKLSFNPATQTELNAVTTALAASGTINTSTNPVDWTQLKNVPAGFADGNDAGGGTSDHGALTGLTDDDHPQYLLGNAARSAPDGFAVTGTFGTGAIPATGGGVRLMWFPRKGAFRVGGAFGTAWDDASVGEYSVAMGATPMASGNNSLAVGAGAIASGAGATAIGALTSASGDSSTAMGGSTTASSRGATAIGIRATASGQAAVAIGELTTAAAQGATALGLVTSATQQGAAAMGWGAQALNTASTAMGLNTSASGVASLAAGYSASATGDYAAALGNQTTAQSLASLVFGRYNAIAGSTTTWTATDPLFVAGNGTGVASRSNALTLLKNGNLTIAGTLTQSSDIRFKEGIRTIDRALDGVLDLRPIYYRFREGTGHPTDEQIGLAAQEVEQIFPQLVHRDSEGKLSVAYTQLAAVLVRAVQEQQATIQALRAELATLRAAVEASAQHK